MFFLVYVVTFLRQIHYMRNYFFTVNTFAEQLLLQSNQFVTIITFVEQLLLQSNYFFVAATFQNTYFFSAVFLSKYCSYLFGAKLLPTSYFLRIDGSFWQLIFRIATIQEDKFAQNIDIYRRVSFSKQKYQIFQNSCFFNSYFLKRGTFQNSSFSRSATFGNSYFFQESNRRYIYFFRGATFLEQRLSEKSYFFAIKYFRRGTFSQIHFLSTATLPIYHLIIKGALHQLQEFFLVDRLLLKMATYAQFI